MPRRWSFPSPPETGWRLLVTAVMLLVAGLRLWHLDNRPPHFDEGVNGMFTDRMVTGGFYAYDPSNYHGPLHFYVLFLFKRLLGRDLWALRLPVALVSIATVWLVFRFERFLPRRVCLLAALGLTLSPGSVYFGRDAIHEAWLAFFLLLTLLGGLGLWRDGRVGDLWAVGLGLAGMVLTKETYVIHVATLGLALGTLAVWEQLADILPRLLPASLAPLLPRPTGFAAPAPARWTAGDLVAVSAVGLGSVVFFYSGTFFNAAGLRGLYETFAPWFQKSGLHRGNGEGHVKPFYYWLELLAGQEPWAFAGMLAAVAFLWVRAGGWAVRFVSIYALGTLLAYCLIPYKTPWCMVSIVWPFFFPAAAALAAGWRGGVAGRVGAGVLLAGFGGFTLWRAVDLSFGHPAEAREEHFLRVSAPPGSLAARVLPRLPFIRPGAARGTLEWDVPAYVYVQTFDVVNQLTLPLAELTRENPANFGLRGLILADHYHPLPWLLGDFYRVGYYGSTVTPPDLAADFLVVAVDRDPEVEAGLREPYFRENIQLRPAMGLLTIYFKASVFQHVMSGREPEFIPGREADVEEAAPAATP